MDSKAWPLEPAPERAERERPPASGLRDQSSRSRKVPGGSGVRHRRYGPPEGQNAREGEAVRVPLPGAAERRPASKYQ